MMMILALWEFPKCLILDLECLGMKKVLKSFKAMEIQELEALVLEEF